MSTRIPDAEGFADPRKVYPWDEWLDGTTHVISWGVDFQRNTDNMVRYAHKVAERRGLKVTHRVHPWNDRDVMLRAYKPDQSPPALPAFPDTGPLEASATSAHRGPVCRICEAPLASASEQFGECSTAGPGGYLDRVPLHTPEES